MPTLYALLIGINAYPISPLSGCLNDVAAVEAYLKKNYGSNGDFSLHIQRITDNEEKKPMRQNIINGFNFFKKAESGDVCLFYYSGHGSFTKAPEEFWTERDGYLESLVCMDSRLPGGRDLMNKEMGYLISKALEGKKDVQFVAITDCCHSGTITKALTENRWMERAFPADNTPVALDKYLGFGDIINGEPAYELSTEEGKKKVTVKQSRHIHLAASQDNQTAKELIIDGAQHGAFTYSLLKSLYSTGGRISYQKLLASATIQVANLVTAQAPVLNLNGDLSDAEGKKYFLFGDMDVALPRYKVYWNNKAGWCVAAGAIHGASVGDKVVIDGVCETRVVDQQVPDFSVLLDKPQLGTKDKEYEAKLVVLPSQKIKLGFSDDLPASIKQNVQSAYQKLQPDYLEFSNDQRPKYYVRNHENGAFIALPDSDVPAFDYTAVNTKMEAEEFIRKIGAVAHWMHLLELNNPSSALSNKQYEISITRNAEPGNLIPESFKEVEDLSKPIELWYQFDGNKWLKPALQITLTNKSNQDLWFSCFYMGVDYSIASLSLKETRLPARMSTKLTIVDKGTEKDVLRFEVGHDLLSKGYNDITEYMKLFISTSRINTSGFNQDGLELAMVTKDLTKALKPKGLSLDDADEAIGNDWKTETIGLHIVRPKESVQLEGSGNVNGIIIEAPPSFSASAALVSSAQTDGMNSKSIGQPSFKRTAALQPFPLLAQTRSASVVDVLELSDVKNAEAITTEMPLTIQLPVTRDAAASSVLPLGFDSETGLYFPLGFVDSDNKVRIGQLPSPSASSAAITAKSLGGSIKIYFQKVVGRWFGKASNYPRLAEPYMEDGEVKYCDDKEVEEEQKLKNKVADATNILLMIHGIIGDTEGMVQCLKTVLDEQGTTADNKVDLALTFDYENLNTSIAETAQALKDKLAAVGLSKGHGKTLIIAAHSMGGLVSRWFIEKLGGKEVVSHLVMYGTPNNGTPWADVRDMAQAIITYGVNGAAFLQPWLFVLSGVGKLVNGTQITFKEMDAETGIYKQLNDGKTDPGIGYTIVSGNTQTIVPDYEKTASLISRLFAKAKSGSYKLLDAALFKKPNDIAVSMDSIQHIAGSESWKVKPVTYTVACDHLNYFVTKEALKRLQG